MISLYSRAYLHTPVILATIAFALPFSVIFVAPKWKLILGWTIIIIQIICLTGLVRSPVNYAGSIQGYHFNYGDLITSDFVMYMLLIASAYTTILMLKDFYISERLIAFVSLSLFGLSFYNLLG